jgi:hypothetical protein
VSNPEHVSRTASDPDSLEVVAGTARTEIEGWIPDLVDETALRDALEKAFDYRGDITITKKDGSRLEGYLFNRQGGETLQSSYVRLIPKNERTKVSISYSDIAALAFSGRDTAAGRSWEAWVKKYWEKKSKGEQNIGLEPELIE